MPLAPHTTLARCLTGRAQWEQNPHAVAWLLKAARVGKDAIEAAELVPLADHRAMLPTLIASTRAHLEALANMSDVELLRMKHRWMNGYTTRYVRLMLPMVAANNTCRARDVRSLCAQV